MKALIIGITGQDGTLLTQRLEASGADVLGFSRTSSYRSCGRPGPAVPDLLDYGTVAALVKDFHPDEIYYLAAFHTSSEGSDDLPSHQAFRLAQDTHVTGLVHCLNAMVSHAPACRLFYAASSLIFGSPDQEVQDETTPLSPAGFYAITKAQAMWLCQEFRRTHGMFAAVGILYNHESHLRQNHFLSKKIIRAAARIASGADERLVLGNPDARVDWSYAPDVIEAMQRILKAKTPETYIVARGEARTVGEFAEIAFQCFGLDWQQHTDRNRALLTRSAPVRIGNPKKLMQETGWQPSHTFPDMVRQLVRDFLENDGSEMGSANPAFK